MTNKVHKMAQGMLKTISVLHFPDGEVLGRFRSQLSARKYRDKWARSYHHGSAAAAVEIIKTSNSMLITQEPLDPVFEEDYPDGVEG